MSPMPAWKQSACVLVLCAVAACSRADPPTGAPPPTPRTPSPAASVPAPTAMRPHELSAAAEAGKQLFFDKALSASGRVACSTCHDPGHAYGPPNDLAVQLAGAQGTSPGVRAVPSLRYKEFTPGYADLLDNSDGVSPPGPGGGFTWDGRADSLGEQARIPLLSPFEMANATPADVVVRLRSSASAAAFVRAFGAGALADVEIAFDKIQLA